MPFGKSLRRVTGIEENNVRASVPDLNREQGIAIFAEELQHAQTATFSGVWL